MSIGLEKNQRGEELNSQEFFGSFLKQALEFLEYLNSNDKNIINLPEFRDIKQIKTFSQKLSTFVKAAAEFRLSAFNNGFADSEINNIIHEIIRELERRNIIVDNQEIGPGELEINDLGLKEYLDLRYELLKELEKTPKSDKTEQTARQILRAMIETPVGKVSTGRNKENEPFLYEDIHHFKETYTALNLPKPEDEEFRNEFLSDIESIIPKRMIPKVLSVQDGKELIVLVHVLYKQVSSYDNSPATSISEANKNGFNELLDVLHTRKTLYPSFSNDIQKLIDKISEILTQSKKLEDPETDQEWDPWFDGWKLGIRRKIIHKGVDFEYYINGVLKDPDSYEIHEAGQVLEKMKQLLEEQRNIETGYIPYQDPNYEQQYYPYIKRKENYLNHWLLKLERAKMAIKVEETTQQPNGRETEGNEKRFFEIVEYLEKYLGRSMERIDYENASEKDATFMSELLEVLLSVLLYEKVFANPIASNNRSFPSLQTTIDNIDDISFFSATISTGGKEPITLQTIKELLPVRLQYLWWETTEGDLGSRIYFFSKAANSALKTKDATNTRGFEAIRSIYGGTSGSKEDPKIKYGGDFAWRDYLINCWKRYHDGRGTNPKLEREQRRFLHEEENVYIHVFMTFFIAQLRAIGEKGLESARKTEGRSYGVTPYLFNSDKGVQPTWGSVRDELQQELKKRIGDSLKGKLSEKYLDAQINIGWLLACWMFRTSLAEKKYEPLAITEVIARIFTNIYLKFKKKDELHRKERSRKHVDLIRALLPSIDEFIKVKVSIPLSEVEFIGFDQYPSHARKQALIVFNGREDKARQYTTGIRLKPANSQSLTLEDRLRDSGSEAPMALFIHPTFQGNRQNEGFGRPNFHYYDRTIKDEDGGILLTRREVLLTLSIAQTAEIMVPLKYVIGETQTTDPAKPYGELAAFVEELHSGANIIEDAKNALTFLHNSFYEGKINAKKDIFYILDVFGGEKIKRILRWIAEKKGMLIGDIQKQAEQLGRMLEEDVFVQMFSTRELSLAPQDKGFKGANLAPVIQNWGDYFFNALLNSAANEVRWNDDTQRFEVGHIKEENPDLIYTSFGDLEKPDVISPMMLRAATLYRDGDLEERLGKQQNNQGQIERGKALKLQAKRSFILEITMLSFLWLLDNYIYDETSFTFNRRTLMSRPALKEAVKEIKTVSGEPPLDFRQRMTARALYHATLGELAKLWGEVNLPVLLKKNSEGIYYYQHPEFLNELFRSLGLYGAKQFLIDIAASGKFFEEEEKQEKERLQNEKK